jgi:formamidopyrimidine-DNA glycosylase
MPELPEVENYCRYIKYTALHATVERVTSPDDDIIKHGLPALNDTVGQKFVDAHRHGKQIFIECDDHGYIRMHCGMTGRPYYFKRMERADNLYPKVIFNLANDYHMAFHDPRKLGEVEWVDDMDQWLADHGLGPDALYLSRDDFHDMMDGRRGYLKSSLMDQDFIAGIGNVYADEICFQAGLHPKSDLSNLSGDQVNDLYDQIQYVLTTAIEARAGLAENYYQNLPDEWMAPTRPRRTFHGEHRHNFKEITVGGRTGYFVPEKQRKAKAA